MVDFNNETTVGTPAAEIVRVLILQRRNDAIESVEAYLRAIGKRQAGELYEVRARLHSLFLELQAGLKRRVEPGDYDTLRTIIVSPESELKDLVEAFEFMNEWLDNLRIIRVDIKKEYDSSKVTDEDQEKGL